jgi:hypothetical protein
MTTESTTAAATTTTAAATTPAASTTTTTPAATTGEFTWTSAGLDPDTLGYVQNKGWKAPTDLVGSYKNLEKLVGGGLDSVVKLPKADAAPEEWAPVYDRLGRPKSPDEYGLPVPEGDAGEFAKTASTWFHEAGLNGRQARVVAEKWNAHVAAEMKREADATAAAHAEQVAALKTEWGANMQANTALVDRAAVAFGMSAEQLNALKATMGPAGAMKFMHAIGSKLGVEGEFITGDHKPDAIGGMTPERAQARINELKNDNDFKRRFDSKDDAVRSDARAEMRKLHLIAYPETPR